MHVEDELVKPHSSPRAKIARVDIVRVAVLLSLSS